MAICVKDIIQIEILVRELFIGGIIGLITELRDLSILQM